MVWKSTTVVFLWFCRRDTSVKTYSCILTYLLRQVRVAAVSFLLSLSFFFAGRCRHQLGPIRNPMWWKRFLIGEKPILSVEPLLSKPFSLYVFTYLTRQVRECGCYRRLRPVRRRPHRQPAGEIAVRAGRVRPYPVSQPTDALRQTATPTAVSAHRIRTSYWAAVLRTTCRQNTNWDSHQGHAA